MSFESPEEVSAKSTAKCVKRGRILSDKSDGDDDGKKLRWASVHRRQQEATTGTVAFAAATLTVEEKLR